jgi:hypothetical protein
MSAWQSRLVVVGPYEAQRDAVLSGADSWEGAATLVADPENRFDPGAVRVVVGRRTIGYLKATTAKHFHAQGEAKVQVPCGIVRTYGGGGHLVRLGGGLPQATSAQRRNYARLSGSEMPGGLDYLQASALIAAL